MHQGLAPRLPAMERILRALYNNDSLLVLGPHHYGKRGLSTALLEAAHKREFVDPVRLTALGLGSINKLNFSGIADTIGTQLRMKIERPSETREDLLVFLTSLLKRKTTSSTVFILDHCVQGQEPLAYELVGIFDDVLRDPNCRAPVSLFVFDDLSLYYYSMMAGDNVSSRLSSLMKQWIAPLRNTEIEALLGDLDVPEGFGEAIERMTGGHVGLVLELLESLLARSKPFENDWADVAEQILINGHILESLREALSEDTQGLSTTAMEFNEPRPPGLEHASPRIRRLRQLGVIQWEGAARAVLCPGIIGELVRQVAEIDQRETRVGSMVRELGPRTFEADALQLDDGDFLTLHVSDLHVGVQHGFRLPGRSSLQTGGQPSVSDMLAKDIEDLGLMDRIDLLIASGDFTETGELTEIKVASDLIKKILGSLQVPIERLVMVAGNHDLRWKKSPLESPNGKGASREGYSLLRALLGKNDDPDADVITLSSRDGSRILRVVALDSNSVEGPEAAGIGYVPASALDTAEAKLKLLSLGENSEESFTWLVTHHHVFPGTSAPQHDAVTRNVSVLANTSNIVAKAVEWGAELIAHGHEHQPIVTVARQWPTDYGESFRPLVCVGAGSLSVKRAICGPFGKNQYFILIRRKDELVVRSRMTGPADLVFRAHEDMRIPLPKALPTELA